MKKSTIALVVLFIAICISGWIFTHRYQSTRHNALVGIDADHDGVRDDVQAYIDAKYPASTSIIRKLLRRQAVITQAALREAGDREASRTHVAEGIAIQSCLRAVVGSSEAKQIKDSLMNILLNTPERTRTYLNRNLGSYIVDSYTAPDTTCNF